jgi:CP family cyanate transporter-like MFS transporter
MLAFGLMNGGYASMIAWLAPHYQELGWSAAQSGTLVALLSIAQAAAALLLPVLAARGGPDRRPWLWFTLGCQALGLRCWPWHLCRATGHGHRAGRGPGRLLHLLHAGGTGPFARPLQAGALNALMQGGGFLLSALPPWLMARLHQGGGGFSGGWWLQCAMALLVAVLVARLAPTQYERVMQPPPKPRARIYP